LLLGGCGKKESSNGGGQVIAHVGPDDVTIQELENEFRLANIPSDKRNDAVTRQGLNEILTRKFLARQAMTAKIDREPTIQLDILRNKEQILARTLVQRNLSASVSSLGQADTNQYIAAHPLQFAKRVVFTTEEIRVPAEAVTPALGEATKNMKTLAEIETKLRAMNIAFQRASGQLDSINLPPPLVAQLQAKKSDDVFLTRVGASGLFFKIVDERAAPLGAQDSEKLAKEMLAQEKLRAANEETARDVKGFAKFEGDYARIMADFPPKADTPPKADASAK